MQEKNKKKLFYLLTFLFFAALPALIIYSLGYTFNLYSREVEKTGSIFIKSSVPRLSIFLNNNFVKETSLISGGALLTGVKEGIYLLRIEKKNYHPWSKAVEVQNEIVTELRNVLLIRHPAAISTSSAREILEITATSTSAVKASLGKKGDLTLESGNKKAIASNIHSFVIIDERILMIGHSGFLSLYDAATGAIETLSHPGFYLTERPAQFVKSPAEEITIVDSGGGIYILENLRDLTPLEGGAKSVAFDEDGEKMLIKKEAGVDILWMYENKYQPFQKKWMREEILKSSEPIEDALWFFGDNAHIVVKALNGLYFTEVDGRGGRNTTELFSGKTDEIFTSPNAPDTIFFRQGKIWRRVEL